VLEFFLSTETPISVDAVAVAPPCRWMQIPHTGIARPAFVLLAGECATFSDPVDIQPGTRLNLRFAAAHEAISADGADLAVELLVGAQGCEQRVAQLDVPAGAAGLQPRMATLDLSPWAGTKSQVRIRCGAGAAGDPTGDWVAIIDLALGSEERLPALRAKAFREERTRNEIAHFSDVYSHAMYQSADTAQRDVTVPIRPLGELLASMPDSGPDDVSAMSNGPFATARALGASDAHSYAHALLSKALCSTPPNFHALLQGLCEGRGVSPAAPPLRVLSLCAGAGRIEASMASAVGPTAEWTLLDISEGLLADAAGKFPPDVDLTLLSGDLNQVRFFGKQFDVIMCVSALHHIVELERVVAFIQEALAEGGQFWSIGEAIGPSGNRLFAEDYRVANAFFRSLPEHLRVNRLSGKVDRDLPNFDYSEATFEGIRSQEIEALLAHRLEPVDVYRRNCFLWRIVDMAYAGNYVLDDASDVAWIHRAVEAELRHFRAGGRATELHAVYRKRVH
jgi:SAM-dependent methyltransferase